MRSISLALFATALLVIGLGAQGRPQSKRISASLEGTNEVPVVISPEAEGSFTATIDEETHEIRYTLRYSGLQAAITQSHIHVAQPAVNGGIIAWLCETAGTQDPDPTAPTPLCGGPNEGTVTGIITAAQMKTAPTQGFLPSTGAPPTMTAEERFHRLVDAIRSGNAYANIHTTQSPGGEIRGQIDTGGGHH